MKFLKRTERQTNLALKMAREKLVGGNLLLEEIVSAAAYPCIELNTKHGSFFFLRSFMTDVMHHKEEVRNKKGCSKNNDLYLRFLPTSSPCSLISGMASGIKEGGFLLPEIRPMLRKLKRVSVENLGTRRHCKTGEAMLRGARSPSRTVTVFPQPGTASAPGGRFSSAQGCPSTP